MYWLEALKFFEILEKGLLIGVIVSAPMGPVGILCIQRTLNKGRWYGFVTGLGAAISDMLYAFITGFALSFVVDFIENERNMFYLQLVGSILLFIFGVYTFRSKPEKNIRPSSNKKGTLVNNCSSAFFITLSNPLIIFLFIAFFARFNFVVPESEKNHELLQIVGFISIFIGALAWWLCLTYFIDKVRTNSQEKTIWILNRVIGVIVMIVSILGFILTWAGLSFH
ncbi:MAG: LysE family transporter [Bacteroidaceae bacterium]|nr:LysE family transporter [Bacteroidaceae bacterium]